MEPPSFIINALSDCALGCRCVLFFLHRDFLTRSIKGEFRCRAFGEEDPLKIAKRWPEFLQRVREAISILCSIVHREPIGYIYGDLEFPEGMQLESFQL